MTNNLQLTTYNKYKKLIELALIEDIGSGDITTKLVTSNIQSPTSKQILKFKAQITLKENGIIAGLPLAKLVYQELDKKVKFVQKVKDGKPVKKGTVIAEISGPAASILTGERLVLNILQHLSGIATLTYQFVSKALRVKVLDTRKTTPLWRAAEKYAVVCGGGFNHRFGLYDGILIKDNHVKILGGIQTAVQMANRANKAGKDKKGIEVETRNIQEVKEAIGAGADKILLDNMNLKTLRKAAGICKKAEIWCEASGRVNLQNVRAIAKTGVNAISIGALTHSAKALDMSLKVI